ncbi:dihydrodipicolinate synthase family protein [uncultured Roseovarius sp.]|uniref:dihydrodipicolinate synthase family protein n=1 Tax=uncultured Roseovarius sp. TaxID=293344 RepID=UPI00261E0328|nr:dihydrodipicolinate synthase family protein [uncultured Roseovarius sp.]
MARNKNFEPRGVIPATLLALNSDMGIDEAASRKHLADCALIDGVAAVTVNGHASEVHACTTDEQKRILEFSLDEVGDKVPLVNGVYADGSHEAQRLARMSHDAGASCLLVFPPQSLTMGGVTRPEAVIEHFRMIADATDLPLIVFRYPQASNLAYPFETMLELFEAVPTIRAIKDWCNDPKLHERHIRTFQSLERPVHVLTTHSAWLMSSLVMGANGLLSGMGSVAADLQVALFRAIQDKDLAKAQVINEQLYPLQQVFYADPFVDMHNRMKEALVMLGRLDQAHMRPPLMKLVQSELDRIREALRQSGLLGEAG